MLFEELLKAIRSDVGLSNRGLKEGEVLRLFIVDDKNEDETPTVPCKVSRAERRHPPTN